MIAISLLFRRYLLGKIEFYQVINRCSKYCYEKKYIYLSIILKSSYNRPINSSSCNYYKFPLIFYRIYNVVDVNANIYLTEWRNRVEGNRRRASGKSVSKRSPDRGDAKFRASPVTKWYVHLFYRASPRGSIPSRMIDASPVPCRWNQKSLIRGRCKTIVSTPGRRCGRSAFLQLASVSSSNFSLFFHTHYLFIYFFLNRYPKGYPFLIIGVVIKKFYYSKRLCFKDQRLLHNRNMEYLYPYFNDTCSKRKDFEEEDRVTLS